MTELHKQIAQETLRLLRSGKSLGEIGKGLVFSDYPCLFLDRTIIDLAQGIVPEGVDQQALLDALQSIPSKQ